MLQSTNFDLEFVHINCQSLAASVRDEALGWVQALSQCMRELDSQALEVCIHLCTMPTPPPSHNSHPPPPQPPRGHTIFCSPLRDGTLLSPFRLTFSSDGS